MNVLILDDDIKICNLIKSLLEKFYSKTIKEIHITNTVKEAVEAINSFSFDIFLFDIHLGQETSFEVFNLIEKTKAKVIFITGHENYAINAIKVDALDYILKPIEIEEFKKAVDKAIQKINKKSKTTSVAQFAIKQENSLLLKALDSIKIIKLNELIYLEASGPYTDVFLTNGDKITVTKHLKDFENKLEDTGFYRVHNSFIINTLKMKEIHKKNGFTVEMNNHKQIVISTRKKDDFMTFIENYLEI